MMISGSVFEEVVDFIECWVHSILYTRKIYPAVLFEQKRYQEISVWQSRHPDINAYIRRVIDNIRPLLEQVGCIFIAHMLQTVSHLPSPFLRVLWTESSSTPCPALVNPLTTSSSNAACSQLLALLAMEAVAAVVVDTAVVEVEQKRTW
jgi:hypothetical protein